MTKIFLVLAAVFMLSACEYEKKVAQYDWNKRCWDEYKNMYKLADGTIYETPAFDWCSKNLEFVVKR